MKRLIALVEGPGDQAAVPVLLRKLFKQAKRYDWQPGDMMRVGELPRLRKKLGNYAEALRIKMHEGTCHGVIVLLDLEDGCPRDEAWTLATEFAAFGLPYPVAVVFAHREYEEWLVASLTSIAPHTDLLPDGVRRDYEIETKRGVKEWLTDRMPAGRIYRETIHQEEFTSRLEPAYALECRSFQRLVAAVGELVAGSSLSETDRRGSTTPRSFG